MGVLKLTDFGFAKETHTRDTLQTPCYTPYYVGKCGHQASPVVLLHPPVQIFTHSSLSPRGPGAGEV